jgi:hypothetical protein
MRPSSTGHPEAGALLAPSITHDWAVPVTRRTDARHCLKAHQLAIDVLARGGQFDQATLKREAPGLKALLAG